MTEDPYEILGVEGGATADEIKVAFIAGAKRFHPDVIGAEESGERMRELNLAYEVLGNPELRAAYDAESRSGVSHDGLFDDLESVVRVWATEAKFTDLPAEKLAALNREMVRMENAGWKVERKYDHLVCTRTERKGLFSKPRKRRVTVNIDRSGRAFQVEQMRPN